MSRVMQVKECIMKLALYILEFPCLGMRLGMVSRTLEYSDSRREVCCMSTRNSITGFHGIMQATAQHISGVCQPSSPRYPKIVKLGQQ